MAQVFLPSAIYYVFVNKTVILKYVLGETDSYITIFVAGKNFLRAGQMNTNVATWARLLKRATPQHCSTTSATLSPGTTGTYSVISK